MNVTERGFQKGAETARARQLSFVYSMATSGSAAPALGIEISNWLAGLFVLVLGVVVPLVAVARHNRLFFSGGGASLPKRSA